MLPRSASAPQALRCIGVGIDTSRYGHYAAFLSDDLQPAADELAFAESADGYQQLQGRFDALARRHGPCPLRVRLDAAGQYADNLLHFLHGLYASGALALTISCGDPQRNKNYRAAVFGPQKSDPVEARAAARFALSERPAPVAPLSDALRTLRQIASRLHALVRQRTRLINQLHHLLALTFPELALLTKDLAAGWVLELVHRYPTAARLAEASAEDLRGIAYLPDLLVGPLRARAGTSVASLRGPAIEELVRDQVRQLRDSGARQKRLENLLAHTYRSLPQDNHLATIPGIGPVTAAVLTAFILDIDRFATPGKLVAYFGILPIEVASGIDRDGKARGPKRFVMSRRGNDLVRRYLWMAALSAIRFNPAVRALYARVVARHPGHKAVAVGHAMRKLLHLAHAVWKTGRPFDPAHFPWPSPVPGEPDDGDAADVSPKQAAGRKPVGPARSAVTAACEGSGPDRPGPDQGTSVDFSHVRRQLPMARVLDQLGLAPRLRGTGPQRRGACPIHRGDARGRTFSVNLEQHVFQCFDPRCGAKGDIIDLWARLQGLSLRDAALDLVRTSDLEPTPRGTEKRNG
jgi:transposase